VQIHAVIPRPDKHSGKNLHRYVNNPAHAVSLCVGSDLPALPAAAEERVRRPLSRSSLYVFRSGR
jgi:hypothetical protein